MDNKDTFGLDPSTLTEEEIVSEIAVHKETIASNQVGTPNVYVRLGDLERELESRKEDTAGAFVKRYTGAKILSISIIDGDEETSAGEAQFEFETDKGSFVG